MPRGVALSIGLHVGVFLIVMFGFPIFFEDDWEAIQPSAVSVEIVPIKDISNLPTAKQPPKPKAAPPKPKPPKPKPPTRKSEPKPPPKPVDAVPLPKPEKPKPEEKPKEKEPEPVKQDEPEEDLFGALMDKLAEDAPPEEEPDKTQKKPAETSSKTQSDRYDDTIPLSLSERDSIRSQFQACWTMPAGAPNPENLVVTLRVQVNPDGSVQQAELVPSQQGRYNSDRFFFAAANSALRAVQLCSPLRNLPPQKYDTWKDMELNFDPTQMLVGR